MPTIEIDPRQTPGSPIPPRRRRRVSVQEAVLRNRSLVAIPALAFAILAIAIGLLRPPTYTAEAQLNVGDTSLPNTSVGQAVLGNQSLTAIYARLIDSQQLRERAAAALGVPADDLRDRLSASPIPESTILRVEGEAGDGAEAINLANAAGNALIAQVEEINNDDARSEALLSQFQEAVKEQGDAAAFRDQRQAAFNAEPTAANEQALLDANAAFERARLRREALEDVYRASQETLVGNRDVQFVNPASSAASDRSSVLQRLVFIGLVGGLAVGVALAALRANSVGRGRGR